MQVRVFHLDLFFRCQWERKTLPAVSYLRSPHLAPPFRASVQPRHCSLAYMCLVVVLPIDLESHLTTSLTRMTGLILV